MTDADEDTALEDVPFEDVVAALLQVDPTGITGQRAKRRDDEAQDAKPNDS